MKFFIAIDVNGVEGLVRAHVVDVLQRVLASSSAKDALDDGLFTALFSHVAAGDIAGYGPTEIKELKISKFKLLDAGSDTLVESLRDTIESIGKSRAALEHKADDDDES